MRSNAILTLLNGYWQNHLGYFATSDILGDEAFVASYQAMQEGLAGDLLEIPFKQPSAAPLQLAQYQAQTVDKHQAIYNAYRCGGYTQKQIGDYFGLHYSQISRIVAKYKT
jgi:putative transposase